MSLKELQAVRRLVEECCEVEGWTDPRNGKPLKPHQVNLYHLDYYQISPRTVPEGVFLKGLASGSFVAGQSVVQNARPGEVLPLAEGVVWGDDEDQNSIDSDRGLHVRVLYGRFDASARSHVLIADVDVGEISEVLSPGALSYKELVSDKPRTPRWYCCHWWGEPIMEFVASCEAHARLRDLGPEEALYWVCAFANRQHSLDQEICSDPAQSSFRVAMRSAEGLLLMLDKDATPFRRIWCDYELYITIMDQQKLLDIITMHEGRPRMLSDKLLPREPMSHKIIREERFPHHLLVRGVRLKLEDGDASMPADKESILGVFSQGHTLRDANTALRSHFAVNAWPHAVKRGVLCDFDREALGTLSLPYVLQQDTSRQTLHLSLAHIANVDNAVVAALASCLSPNLINLHLSFQSCTRVTDQGAQALADSLPGSLRTLWLDFSMCPLITDAGVAAIAEAVPLELSELCLLFQGCIEVGSDGLAALAEKVPQSLSKVKLGLHGTGVDSTITSIKDLRRLASRSQAPVRSSSILQTLGSGFDMIRRSESFSIRPSAIGRR